jgi:hypothetical protein
VTCPTTPFRRCWTRPGAERLSLTAALERLLETEVEATEARKLAGRLRFACLPEPWHRACREICVTECQVVPL